MAGTRPSGGPAMTTRAGALSGPAPEIHRSKSRFPMLLLRMSCTKIGPLFATTGGGDHETLSTEIRPDRSNPAPGHPCPGLRLDACRSRWATADLLHRRRGDALEFRPVGQGPDDGHAIRRRAKRLCRGRCRPDRLRL